MTSRGPMTACDTYLPMIGSRPGELSAAESGALDTHLAGCEGCRRWAAELASTEWMISEALLAEAAKRDFAPFVDGVMARVEGAKPQPLLARLGRLMRLHPRLVIGGALAPLVAALALGLRPYRIHAGHADATTTGWPSEHPASRHGNSSRLARLERSSAGRPGTR